MNDTRMIYERRGFLRANSDFPVKLKQVSPGLSVQINNSFSKDISETGIQLSSFYFYPVKSKLLLEASLSAGAEPVKVMGKVVWVEQFPYQERFKLGVHFEDLSQEARFQFRDVVAKTISSNKQAESPMPQLAT
ncbi:MAG: PilZ domain-containing protein [PVC group bacterium]|nr:PilZ domain-containing protein [PVC group bacterium]